MKKFLIAATILMASTAFASDLSTQQKQQQTATSTGQATVDIGCLVNCASTDQGQRDAADALIQSTLINADAGRDIATINSDVKVRNTPSVSGQALTTSNDTCMGSASGSVNVPGFGASLGKTYTDDNCIRLKNSRELWNKGMKAASLAMDCKDPDMKEALEMTGYECPQTTRAKQAAAAKAAPATASVNGYTGTDPIVLQRIAGK